MEIKRKSRFKAAKNILIFWTLFIGIGALAGGYGMLADTSGRALGMDTMLPYFKVLPFSDILFRDLLFSGIALICVNGLTNIIAAVLLFCKKKIGVTLGMIFGVTLMLWICIQFYMFPPNFMSTIYFFFGLAQAITGYTALVFLREDEFALDESLYKNIGKNPKSLVVYFSRMGYVKKFALEEADIRGADVYEIKTTEKTDGFGGFMWCGRFAVHRWSMPIEPITVDTSKYESVIICTPIWAFDICAPVRGFLTQTRGKIKNAELITVHFTAGGYKNAVKTVERLLGIKIEKSKSIICHEGRMKVWNK